MPMSATWSSSGSWPPGYRCASVRNVSSTAGYSRRALEVTALKRLLKTKRCRKLHVQGPSCAAPPQDCHSAGHTFAGTAIPPCLTCCACLRRPQISRDGVRKSGTSSSKLNDLRTCLARLWRPQVSRDGDAQRRDVRHQRQRHRHHLQNRGGTSQHLSEA